MKRPPPRTLAAAPPSPPLRVPVATAHEARFPALTVLLASGVVLPACADPVCGVTRADELEAHGRASARAASGGEASRAMREIGIALGVVAHPATTVPDNGMHTAGVPVPVEHTPPLVTTPPVVTTPPADPPDVDGGIRTVRPTPPTNPTNPRPTTPRTPEPPRPVDQPVPLGGAPPPITPTPPTPPTPPRPPTPPTPPRVPDIVTAGEPMAVTPLPTVAPGGS